MKGAYLFAVLVGIKTILAEIQEGATAPYNNYDDDEDTYGEVEEYDEPSYGGKPRYDVDEYDGYKNKGDKYGNYDEEEDSYEKPSRYGEKPAKKPKRDYYDEEEEEESYGKKPTKKPTKKPKRDYYDEEEEEESYGKKPTTKPTKKPKRDYYDEEEEEESYGKKPVYKPKPDYGYGEEEEETYGDKKPGYGKKPVYKPKPDYGYGEEYDDEEDYYKPSKSKYGKPNKKPTKPGYGNIHGDDYDEDDYRTYAPPVYEPWTAHYKKDNETPFPYTFFTEQGPKAASTLKVPKLGDYHCFLTGAPWTSCGRKSLTNYFLDQCLVLYFTLSANVDGICGGEPPKPTPKPTEYNDDYYSSDYKKRPTPEPTTTTTPKPKTTKKPDEGGYGSPATAAPTPTSASYEITPDYLKEKCLQSAYVSITTATVMCLTENYIRINFIEHYAADACNNPVEGPILYLRKLHAFVKEVIECNPTAPVDFPNLYKSSSDNNGYNPNAPYYLNDGKVDVQQYTSGEASGLGAFTIGDRFACANPNDLVENPVDNNAFVYLNIPSTTHYWTGTSDANSPSFNSASKYSNPVDSTSYALRALGDRVYRFCKKDDYTTDRTLRGLYDAVHYVERDTSVLRRPQSIAEIAVRSAGFHEQPILEGFGILYYCAFHACRANNNGDLSKCYPEFSDKDWHLPQELSIKHNSAIVSKCIDEDFLTTEHITTNEYVQAYNQLLSKRSYLCLAEHDIVNFLEHVYTSSWATKDDALSLVYGRHLADERAEVLVKGEAAKCPDTEEVYKALNDALVDLIGKCKDNQEEAAKPKIYGKPQYGNPQKGGKYGRPDKYDA